MSLNLPTKGGDFTPFLKYNAKSGRFFIRIEGADQDQEIDKPSLVIDMANIKTGLICFPLNGAPQTIWDTLEAQAYTTLPGQWKRGFKVVCFGVSPIGLREWSSNSINTNAALVKMYATWEAAQEHADYSKVPWFKNTGVMPIESSFGTNYEPLFNLGGFTDRAGRFPEENGTVEAQTAAPAAQQTAPVPNAQASAQQSPAPAPTVPVGTPADTPTVPAGSMALDDDMPF